MQPSSDHPETSPLVPHPETTNSITENPSSIEKLELFSRLMPALSSISLSKLIVGGLIFLGLPVTFFVFTKGTQICLFSYCPPIIVDPLTDDFLAFAVGSGTLMVFTTFAAIPLLPAIAASIGVWLVMQYFN
ncbi:hypothetical protein [Chamaesiphon sp.]|uniref:hypothetical protein n=1 Tax=Chamaesiphon sp. TaxID=2814140 RepID=UPI0035937B76